MQNDRYPLVEISFFFIFNKKFEKTAKKQEKSYSNINRNSFAFINLFLIEKPAYLFD